MNERGFDMVKRIHFAKKENIIVEDSDKRCSECGEEMISIYEKGWIFRKHLGDYCFNEKCEVGEYNIWLDEILEENGDIP